MKAGVAAAAAVEPPSPELPHLHAFVAELAAHGLRHVAIAPGARSTPLTVSLTREPRLDCRSHVDERSAAFFALGAARATRNAAAIVCTSGTAAANFYPAIVEAAQAGVSLIVLTADRPPELRDCEAGQAIDQIKMYGGYAKWFAEAGMADAGIAYFRGLARRALREANDTPRGVVHINFPLREPLIATATDRHILGDRDHSSETKLVAGAAPAPASGDVARLAAAITTTPRGLILCGAADHDDGEAAAIARLAAHSGYPIFADPTSQLRRKAYSPLVVASYDALVADRELADPMVPELVLRFAGSPVCKPLRLWLERHAVPQIVFDERGRWNDPSGTAVEIWRTDTRATCEAVCAAAPPRRDSRWSAAWRAADARATLAKAAFLRDTATLSGVGLFARLADRMGEGSLLYVGNSLPIRQLEAAWPGDAASVRVLCNRGANGIDGMVSSILGAAAASDAAPVVGVLGDLSFYHDLNGLLAARRRHIDATLIVLNNDGGGIFSMLPQAQLGDTFDEFFTTPHGLAFEHAARLYGCAFDRVESWDHFESVLRGALDSPGTNIIEVRIDRDADLAITRELLAAGAAAARVGIEE